MAGNEEVIESLKLELNVTVNGQDRLTALQGALTAFAGTLERVNAQLREYQRMAGNVNRIRMNIPTMSTPQSTPQASNANVVETMTTTWESVESQVYEVNEAVEEVNDTIGRTVQTMSRLGRASLAAQKAVKSVKSVLSSLKDSAKASVTHIKKLVNQFLRIAKMRAMRAIIRGIISGLKEGIQNLAQFDSGFNKTMTDFVSSTLYLKNALATLAQPLLQIVLPVIETVIDYIVEAINRLNEFIAQIKGEGTYIAAKKATKQYAENMESATDSAKELKRTLMGFDEINKLNDNTSSAKAGKGGVSASDMFEVRTTDQSEDVVEKVRKQLRAIERVAGAFLLAIGAVLLVTGHIPLGVACIIAGIKIMQASLKYGEMEDRVGKTLSTIEAILGSALLAVGAILAFSGHIGIGIALMATGAMVLAASVALDWNNLTHKVKNVISVIMSLVAGAAIVVGVILLAVPMQHGLGIALIIAGISLFAVSAVTLSWDAMPEKVKTVVSTILTIISGAALVIGAIMIATPTFWHLGIPLMAAGAIGLVTTTALNWDSMPEKIRTVVTTIMTVVGTASLAVGAILAFSGANIPLGIALMALGGVSLATAATLNWDELTNGFTNAMRYLLSKVTEGLNNLSAKFKSWKPEMKTPHFQWQADGIQAQGAIKKLLQTLNLPTSLPKLHIQWYATGGFPEDGLFFANHSELVGKFSNGRTAVANNQQIEAGIEEAAYRGFMRAMQGQGGSTTFIAQLNGKTIFEEVVRQNNNATKTYGSSPLTAF